MRFLSRGDGYVLFLTGDEVVWRLDSGGRERVVRMRMSGARREAKLDGMDPLPGAVNYFTGAHPAGWHTGIKRFRRLRARQVYPGVDIDFHGDGGELEYDFRLAPGADPGRIELEFQGVDEIRIGRDGDLVLAVAGRNLIHRKPRVYQEVHGVRTPVAGRFRILPGNHAGFEIGSYRKDLPLVIDPALTASTYLGGGKDDYATAVAVDGTGNVYLAGYTLSVDFPVTSGAVQKNNSGNTEVYVSKMTGDGKTLLYSTYLGGPYADRANALAVDSTGNAYIAGRGATGFPVTAGAYRTSCCGAFVAKLNPAGDQLLYSTFLGSGEAFAAAVDSSGSVYVAGRTSDANFPVTPGAYQTMPGGSDDAFVSRLSADGGSLVYSTFLGGGGFERARSVAIDSAGNACVAGYTTSSDFPATAGAPQQTYGQGGDGFLTKLKADGTALHYSTFLGGGSADEAGAVAVDALGNCYTAGYTDSNDFPTTSGAYQAAATGRKPVGFITGVNASGTAWLYSTCFGERICNDFYSGFGITVNGAGEVSVTGSTASASYPVTADAIQSTIGGGADAFLTEFNQAGSELIYSTFLGGGADDFARGIARSAAGALYLAGITFSTNFPVTSGSFQEEKK